MNRGQLPTKQLSANNWVHSTMQLMHPNYWQTGNGMRTQIKCSILTSKDSAKLNQYYYFHAEFLEEIW